MSQVYIPNLIETLTNTISSVNNSNLKESGKSFADILNERKNKISRQKTALVMNRNEKKSAEEERIERKKAKMKLLKKQEILENYEERVEEAAINEIEGQIRRNERAAALAGEGSALATSRPPLVTHSLAALILSDLISSY